MLEALFSGVFSFLVRVVKPVIQAVLRAIVQEISPPHREAPNPLRQAQLVKEIDQEMEDRERHAARGGRSLTTQELSALEDLSRQKNEAFAKFEEGKRAEAAQVIAETPSEFASSPLVEGNEHQIQYHLGLVVLEKRCSCGFPMKLQHQTVSDPTFADFFWQCTRFYADDGRPKCRGIQFRPQDLSLLHKTDAPELEISKDDLRAIGSEKSVQTEVTGRMRGHLGTGDQDILCPTHLIPLVLREKSGGASGPLLDRYHLRCSHFQCGQTTKLKSFAQLAAYLKRKEGHGILH